VKTKIILIAAVFILAIIVSGAVSATPAPNQIYVSPDGNDVNDGATPETAVQTINMGIQKVAANGKVNLAAGTYNKSGPGNSKDVNITISKNLTLQGAGKDSTIIDALGNAQIFDIDYDLTVVIKGITFKNGKLSNSGGAISSDATLTVQNCAFINNEAVGDGGGAIFTHTILNVINCVFTGNKADAGAAIFNKGGTLTVTGSTFTVNQALTDLDKYSGGGAIHNYYGTYQIIGNTFINNVNSAIHITSGDFLKAESNDNNGIPANKINFNRFAGNKYAIYQDTDPEITSELVDAQYNWWGSNNPNFATLLHGNIDYTPWIYMKLDPTQVKVNKGDNVPLVASFNYLYDGNAITPLNPVLHNHIPDGTPVLFTTNLGEVGSKSITKYTNGGVATAILRATESGIALITATTDSQVTSAEIVVSASSTVNGETVPMQSTGIPLVGLILAILMVTGGIIGSKK
jgi:predicted outer membrane repeat protein